MPDRPEPRLARGPHRSHHEGLAAGHDARVLDPSQAPVVPGVDPSPTAYVATRLMVAKGPRLDAQVALLQMVAQDIGWNVRVDREPAKARGLRVGVRTVQITTASPSVDRQPDAWYLLQKARLHVTDLADLAGVGLDHLVSTRPYTPMPF